MPKNINYINLTNGLEYIDKIKNYKFIRIQSSLLEQKLFDRVLQDLDYNFLIDLAQGNYITIYDTSRKKKESRALYQGVEFIKFVLNKRWFGKNEDAYIKGMKVTEYFEIKYNSLALITKKKIDYVKKFLNTDEIYIKTCCKKSLHDGEYDYYKNILREQVN